MLREAYVKTLETAKFEWKEGKMDTPQAARFSQEKYTAVNAARYTVRKSGTATTSTAG